MPVSSYKDTSAAISHESPEVTSKEQSDQSAYQSVRKSSKSFEMLQDVKDFYMKKEDCDIILKMKDHEFPARRSILKARSPVFASMLRNATTNVIEIEDSDPSVFSDFLGILYGGIIDDYLTDNTENISKVCSLFTIADKYNVRDLRSQCWEFLISNLSPANFSHIMSLPLKDSEKDLVEYSTDFFSSDKEFSWLG